MIRFKTWKILCSWALLFIWTGLGSAQESTQQPQKDANTSKSEFAAQIQKYAKKKARTQKYTLKYKFKKGDVIRWQHDHRIVNETKFGTEAVKTSTRARPEYSWTVQNVDGLGNMRFEIMMERIKVWEQNGSADQVHYDSDKDKTVPESCVVYHERVGRPSSMYSISKNGQIVDSKSYYDVLALGGVGENPVIAFPDKPIGIGKKWGVEYVKRAKDEFGSLQQINLRVGYELAKVVDGKAHVTFKTSVLTPMTDETIHSQIVTHLARGFAVFDIEKGMLTHRETNWDERVIGYRGQESYMHYQAFRKETLVVEPNIADVKTDANVLPVSHDETIPTGNLLKPLKKKASGD